MRALAQFEDERVAGRLGAVLYHEGVDNRIEQTRDGLFTVWIIDEPSLDRAKAVLEVFEKAPSDPRYEAIEKESRARQKQDQKIERVAAEKSRERQVDFRRREARMHDVAPVTWTLIGVSVLVYVFIEFFHQEALRGALLYARNPTLAMHLGLGIPQAVDGQWWRIVTPIFLHASPGPNGVGILHILFNMWWLKDLGPIVERVHGKFYLVALVLVSAAVSNSVQYVWDGPFFVGMSGVVYALFGFIWIRGKFDPRVPYRVPQSLAGWMMIWFILCWLGFVGNVANMVHAGGLVVGAVWGFVSARLARR
ncbi:MAG: rhomboid family intramembrane serine protease [Myxococcales bacterium]|nr:rhomboid family intramembrane serine protease [Myxococcales bacterium]